jgi:hypothetical protein
LNPDIHPAYAAPAPIAAYAAPAPIAFNPDIHPAYAAPPTEVRKLHPAASKVSAPELKKGEGGEEGDVLMAKAMAAISELKRPTKE